MNKNAMTKVLRNGIALLMAAAMLLGAVPAVPVQAAGNETSGNHASYIQKIDAAADYKEYLNKDVAFQLSENIQGDEQISVIITVDVVSLMDAYEESDKSVSFADFALYSQEAARIREQIAQEKADILAVLDEKSVAYEVGEEYDTLVSGFELVIQAADYVVTCQSLTKGAKATVGESYRAMETEAGGEPGQRLRNRYLQERRFRLRRQRHGGRGAGYRP